MQELLNRVLTEVRGSWRFRWQGLAIAWAIAVAGCALVYVLPNAYRSDARVHVDTQSLLGPLLHGLAVQPDLNTRVNLMTNTLLSRANLEKIAQKADLLLAGDSPERKLTVLDKLRSDIKIHGERNDLYTIEYHSSSPQRAQRVVQIALNILMESTLGSTQQDSTSARQFLSAQVQSYGNKLQADEQRLAKFRREHIGLVPDQGGSDYYQRLNQAEQKLNDLRDQLATAQSQRGALVSELVAMRNGKTASTVTSPQLQALDRQIHADTTRLNNLLLNYTERYPDVISLKQSIRRLQQQRAELANRKDAVSSRPEHLSANPVYQKLQMSLNDANVTIDTLRPKIAEQQRNIVDLKSKVDQITNVEAELAKLNRNYEVTKKQYQELLARLNSAELSGDVQHSGDQIKFQIIDPPNLPLRPSAPNRMLFLGMVFLASLAAGAVFAFFLHQIRPVFMNRRELEEVTGVAVLGSVSLAASAAQQRLVRRRLIGFACGVLLLAVFFGGGIVFADHAAQMLHSMLGGAIL